MDTELPSSFLDPSCRSSASGIRLPKSQCDLVPGTKLGVSVSPHRKRWGTSELTSTGKDTSLGEDRSGTATELAILSSDRIKFSPLSLLQSTAEKLSQRALLSLTQTMYVIVDKTQGLQ